MNLKIEKMTLDNLISIKDILISDFDDFWTYEILNQELECENSYVIVAKGDNGEIVGFACLKVILDEADIMNIVVKKSFRNNGIGSILLEYLISFWMEGLYDSKIPVRRDNSLSLPVPHISSQSCALPWSLSLQSQPQSDGLSQMEG